MTRLLTLQVQIASCQPFLTKCSGERRTSRTAILARSGGPCQFASYMQHDTGDRDVSALRSAEASNLAGTWVVRPGLWLRSSRPGPKPELDAFKNLPDNLLNTGADRAGNGWRRSFEIEPTGDVDQLAAQRGTRSGFASRLFGSGRSETCRNDRGSARRIAIAGELETGASHGLRF